MNRAICVLRLFRRPSISFPVSQLEDRSGLKQIQCSSFVIWKLNCTSMSERQLRLRKERVTSAETVARVHTMRHGTGSTKPGKVRCFSEVILNNDPNFESVGVVAVALFHSHIFSVLFLL